MTLQELISTCLDGQDAVALAKAQTALPELRQPELPDQVTAEDAGAHLMPEMNCQWPSYQAPPPSSGRYANLISAALVVPP